MNRNRSLLISFLCLFLADAAAAQQAAGGAPQESVPTKFPEQLLQGTDNFNLAIDIYSDARGNFGPCG